jgi:hypothetical protein
MNGTKAPLPEGAALIGFLHQRSPVRSDEAFTGICVHLASRRTLLPTGRCALANLFALPQPLGLTCGAEHSRLRTLVVPFGVFGSVRWPRVSPQRGRPLRIGRSLRVVGLLRYRPYWLGGPTMPLAVSSAVWFSCKRLRWQRSSLQSNPLSSLASVSSRTKLCLADQPQPASSSLGLLLPTAHEEPKIHLPRARPPATVRLQGLATLLTAYALRSPAGSISHRQRSWDPRFGAFSSRKVSGALPPG